MISPRQEAANKSLNTLVFVLTILLVFIMAARTPLETDLGWHLKAGETTWENRQPLTTDLFSYTRYGEKWVNHSWLGQVMFYLSYRGANYLGIGLLVALSATLSMVLVYMSMDGPAFLRAFIIVLASMIAAWVWSARPQVLSLVMLAALALILSNYKRRGVDRLWVMLPLFVLWSNLHGGYALGFMLLATAIGGEILNHVLGNGDEAVMPWKQILRLTLWAVGCGFAALINPNGIDTWLIPFQTVGVKALQQFISEWASADFHDFAQQPLLWMVFGLIGAIGLSGKRLDGVDFLGILVFGYSAFVARRNFGPFAIVAAPILCRHLWAALQAWWSRMPRLAEWYSRVNNKGGMTKPVPAGIRKTINYAIVGLLVLIALLKLIYVNYTPLVEAYIHNGAEARAVEWVKENQPEGRMFSSYNWGGYLIWNLPEYPVFIDGRTDLFGDEMIGEWIEIVNAEEGWQQKLNHWQVRLILLEPDRPIVKELGKNGWTLYYSDDGAVVYGR